jgi:hypothetical protein
MDQESYLQRLTSHSGDGLLRVDAALRQRQTAYLLACQNADSGFSGREGDSDLDYTACGPARNTRSVGFRKCGGIDGLPWDNGVFSRETSARPERSNGDKTPPAPPQLLEGR